MAYFQLIYGRHPRRYENKPFAGFTQVLLGQPFDTIKVRLQASIEYQSIRECINRLIINEGPEGFFKGK